MYRSCRNEFLLIISVRVEKNLTLRGLTETSPSQHDDITAVLAGRLVDRDDEELLDWVFGEETNEADSDNDTEEFEQYNAFTLSEPIIIHKMVMMILSHS